MQDPKVNYFRYFTNELVVHWLPAALGRGKGDEAGFMPTPRANRPALPSRRSNDKPHPIVVALPTPWTTNCG